MFLLLDISDFFSKLFELSKNICNYFDANGGEVGKSPELILPKFYVFFRIKNFTLQSICISPILKSHMPKNARILSNDVLNEKLPIFKLYVTHSMGGFEFLLHSLV